MKLELTRYVPPGLNAQVERRNFIITLALEVGVSLSTYLYHYGAARNLLFWIDGRYKELRPGAVMEDFYVLLEDVFTLFPILWVMLAGFAVWHYAYHHMGSKSIYLMRRLPDRWELHRRCLALPAAGCVISLVVCAALVMVYFGIYMLFTPRQCIAPGQWQMLWR